MSAIPAEGTNKTSSSTNTRNCSATCKCHNKRIYPMVNRMIYRDNRVPFYQKLYQANDGVRQWWKTSRSPYLLYPYFIILGGGFAGSMYCMVRMTLGKKTWFGD